MTDMTADLAGLDRGVEVARRPQPPAAPPRVVASGDSIFRFVLWACGLLVLALLGGIIALLFQGGLPALLNFGPAFLWTTSWNPVLMRYGAGVMIYGTLFTSIIA